MKYLYLFISMALLAALLVRRRLSHSAILPHRYTAEEVGVWDALIDALMADQEQDA